MPELPEVEVTKLGIAPYLIGSKVTQIRVHQRQLRWLVPYEIEHTIGEEILEVSRRAKYLLVTTTSGSIVLHLGMSGKMRVVNTHLERKKHDHLEIILNSGKKLVLNDPRRFGSCLWQGMNDAPLRILSSLGPEPLTDNFDGMRLFELSRGRTPSVKSFIMDNKVVVGVGNIYANEALFKTGIDPRRPAGKISKKRYLVLASEIKKVLANAISQGGTTLNDFSQPDGSPGYFAQHLSVYGRAGKPCEICGTEIKSVVIAQRNTFYCVKCQK